ncbi:MAG: rRNA maturation RNase YbeY [Clostridia bacterium]|jgi:probable rRNA maturation factor|nr:rRNA maturation RNase YbeY [Clostridia bacterium]
MIDVFSETVELSEAERTGIRNAAQAALDSEGRDGDLTILIDTPERIQTLNREFRHVDAVTDVLTFPAWEGEISLSADGYLGDIMICYDRAKEQAEQYGHSLLRELSFLAVHGCLHLLGYDHMTEADERVMREKQTAILDSMGVKR